MKTKLNKIFSRHLGRLLEHYDDTGQLTKRIEADTKRNYGYVEADVDAFIAKGYVKKGLREL